MCSAPRAEKKRAKTAEKSPPTQRLRSPYRHCKLNPADERAMQFRRYRYTVFASSAVNDSARKHSPCPLIATTGGQRKPGVHVCLAAESPMAPKPSHLNPGFKVVSRASAWRRTYLYLRAMRLRGLIFFCDVEVCRQAFLDRIKAREQRIALFGISRYWLYPLFLGSCLYRKVIRLSDCGVPSMLLAVVVKRHRPRLLPPPFFCPCPEVRKMPRMTASLREFP